MCTCINERAPLAAVLRAIFGPQKPVRRVSSEYPDLMTSDETIQLMAVN